MRRLFRNIFVLFLTFCSLPVGQLAAQGLGRGTPDRPITNWPVADPDSLGLDAAALEEHRVRCEESEASACLVVWRGEIIQEWYAPDYPSDPIAMQPWIGTRSAAKSVGGLLAGMLIADGNIPDIDTPVSEFIPEWVAGADSGVTVRHLLTMTSGVARNPEGVRGPGVVAAKNLREFAMRLPLEATPGERWNYSNEGAQLLAAVMEEAADMPLAAYARERLFDPIGMATSFMRLDEYANTVLIGGMRTRLREFARIGQLVANNGSWNGSQLVPEAWIRAMLTPVEQNEYYGYLWWIDEELGAYSAAGTFDQLIYVLPDVDLVAVRLQRDVKSGRTGDYWGRTTPTILRRIVRGGGDN